MHTEPQTEHQWLNRFIGEWISGIQYGTGSTVLETKGTEVVRSLGGLWIVSEGEGEMPDGRKKTVMTLGYDPQNNRYVGTFIPAR